jgi:tetratricopeptide (TPR) repeat protein
LLHPTNAAIILPTINLPIINKGSKMTLILVAVFGIIIGRWAIARRSVAILSIPCEVSGVDVTNRSACDRLCGWCRAHADQWRNALGLTLLLAIVAVGITEIQSQTNSNAKSPPSEEFYLQRGESLSGAQEYDQAIANYTAAIELKPNYAEAYNDRGFSYYLKGDFERAISDFTRAIELRPKYPKAYNSRGVAYMQGGYGAAKSVPDFDRAIELKPDFRYTYINRANARLFRHPGQALQDFHRAGMHPERTVAILASAVLLFALAVALLVLKRRAREHS